MINKKDTERIKEAHIQYESEVQKRIEEEIYWDNTINVSSNQYKMNEISVVTTISLIEEFSNPSHTSKGWILLELLSCKDNIKKDKLKIIENKKSKQNIKDLKVLKVLFEKNMDNLKSYCIGNSQFCLSNKEKDNVKLSIYNEIDRLSSLEVKINESQLKKTCFENIKHILKIDGLKNFDDIAKHIVYINNLSISKNNKKEYSPLMGTFFKITLEEKKQLNMH